MSIRPLIVLSAFILFLIGLNAWIWSHYLTRAPQNFQGLSFRNATSTDIPTLPTRIPRSGERSEYRQRDDQWVKKNGQWEYQKRPAIGEAFLNTSGVWLVNGSVQSINRVDHTVMVNFASDCVTTISEQAGVLCGAGSFSVENPVAVYYSFWDQEANPRVPGWEASFDDIATGDRIILWVTKDVLEKRSGTVRVAVFQ